MEGLKYILFVLCVVTKHSSSELISQENAGPQLNGVNPPNSVVPSEFPAPSVIEENSRENAGISQGVQNNPTSADTIVEQNEMTQLGDVVQPVQPQGQSSDTKVPAETDPRGDSEESQVNTNDDLETVTRRYGDTSSTNIDKSIGGTGVDNNPEMKSTQQEDNNDKEDDDDDGDYDDEDWYDPNDYEEEDENTMKDYVGGGDEDDDATYDDDDEEYEGADWKPHVKETDEGDESEDAHGRNEEDDDDEDYDISQWSRTDNDNSDYDEENANDAQDDVESPGIHEDVVDEELAKKNRPPTAPSSMVLFYTWMIVVILIMVVGISTYQSRCRGFKLFGSKSSSQTEDKKRLLEHEYV